MLNKVTDDKQVEFVEMKQILMIGKIKENNDFIELLEDNR
jgi:hypothetical protein